MNRNIAIDGPSGAGKSTIAKLVASELGAVYVDTGAMYRAIGLFLKDHGVEREDAQAVADALSGLTLSIRYPDGAQQVLLNGADVTGRLRAEDAGMAASHFSVVPAVREKLVHLQQELASHTAVVMDGRDIGTKVLPDAAVKIYLTASARVRAERRCAELREKGSDVSLEQIEADIKLRDHQDMAREVSPLVKAADAVEVDCSALCIGEVVSEILRIFREKTA